ncbi:hypothetical protein D3C76_728760 [compost metagenome]|uniref:DUF2164 domain-containing protein n=1 Tax=Pseudomonas putida TaxID=303 RepID=UPI000F96AE77|nr:DUF2164 domain-containing protein [Pseudomonas putida]MDD2011841.1 DUF2164 domain-containing protein [Pseudomonas putida]HDS1779637.1 DUF2164 family protein [Pseudomonas putida]
MSKAEIPKDEKTAIIAKLKQYCSTTFDLNLGQFEAEFFLDFIEQTCGPALYNCGIDAAIRTHVEFSERIQEEIDLKRII